MLRIRPATAQGAAAPAWVEVDLAAIRHNVRELQSQLAGPCQLIAVVKANGYGHGMLPVARTALSAGADQLAVGSADEGAALRQAGITAPILITGPSLPEQAPAILAHRLTPSLGNLELARALHACAERPLDVHVEVDTGMRRHGAPAAGAAAFCRELQDLPRLRLQGVYTHFAALHERDLPALRLQLASFRTVVDDLRRLPLRPALHVCNTLAALLLPPAHLDAVRIGGGLYGFDPLRGRGPVQLRPALQLKCRIAGLRDARPGDPVGYGGTFVCRRPTRLALLPIGYAEGLQRAFWTGAEVLVRGRRARLVGLVSMSLSIADVTDVPGAALGDEVVLIGEQGQERIAAEERVPAGGSVYEVTSPLAPSLPRQYVGDLSPLPRDLPPLRR